MPHADHSRYHSHSFQLHPESPLHSSAPLVAALVTLTLFAALFASTSELRSLTLAVPAAPPFAPAPPLGERLIFLAPITPLAPPTPPGPPAEALKRPAGSPRHADPPASTVTARTEALPTVATRPDSVVPASATSARRSILVPSPATLPLPLASARSTRPILSNMLERPAVRTRAEEARILGALGRAVPALARSRTPFKEEHEEAMREISRRAHADRPAVTSSPAGGSIPLPIFSRGPSRAERARAEKAFEESLVLLERLQLRARARRDSVAHADSMAGVRPGP